MSETGGTIKVVCDTESGITSTQLMDLSREITQSDIYDQDYSEIYQLEVSSPGIDAKLTEVRHFKKNLGRYVQVYHEMDGVKSPVEGKIISADSTRLVLEKKSGKIIDNVQIPFKDIDYGKIIIKW